MAAIRVPDVNDAPALIEMVRQFPTPTPSTDESLAEILRRKLRDPLSYVLVAEDETGLVGYISGCRHVAFYAGGNTAWIDEIFVRQQRRGKGIGRLLMEALEARAAADGCLLVALATAGAGPFYSRIGYETKAGYFKKYLRSTARAASSSQTETTSGNPDMEGASQQANSRQVAKHESPQTRPMAKGCVADVDVDLIEDERGMQTEIAAAAERIRAERYPDAEVVFLAGSLVRGEGTGTSDLDLVVLYARVKHAYRESFRFSNWPVEAFVHDPKTLKYFFQQRDKPSGIPSLMSMVSEGIEIPGPSELSRTIKDLAESVLSAGPPPWQEEDVDRSRYTITGLVDDLRDARSRAEVLATGVELFQSLATHYFRSNGHWSAKGKMVPRKLRAVDPQLAASFEYAFLRLMEAGEPRAVIDLSERLLAGSGGWLFNGYAASAPEDWRVE